MVSSCFPEDDNGSHLQGLYPKKFDKITQELTRVKLCDDVQGRTCLRFDWKSGGSERSKQKIKYKFDSNCLLNVGDHFPGKGVGTDHTFVVCREKKKQWIKAYTRRECPFKESKSAFMCVLTCLFINHEGTCFQVFTKKCSDTFHTVGFQDCS